MTELSFAQSFISLLGTIPSKISHDHVEDPRRYTITTPYTLPHHPSQKPFRRQTSTTPGQSSSDKVTVTAVSPRNPPLSITIDTALPVSTTSVLDVKNQIAAQTGIPLPKIKLLYQKKPAQDSKTLKDILAGSGAGQTALEFGLMIIGGAASVPAEPPKPKEVEQTEETLNDEEGDIPMTDSAPVAAPGQLSGKEVLSTDEFWEDLRGFLEQRVKDEQVAREAVGRFRQAWTAA
ncbi:cell-cycle control medial ring component [Apiosordaria backusii]|uniref:Cell-cycle control medial ring component n=1 Tax=Apiosordaria backusii TaxID=314023 RepID=A0AA40K0R0_9PEZI|nr:cell-cycle control medial ring component [Apiosordaria backusii]